MAFPPGDEGRSAGGCRTEHRSSFQPDNPASREPAIAPSRLHRVFQRSDTGVPSAAQRVSLRRWKAGESHSFSEVRSASLRVKAGRYSHVPKHNEWMFCRNLHDSLAVGISKRRSYQLMGPTGLEPVTSC